MNKIKDISEKFKNSDITMKASVALLTIIIILGIIQGCILLGDKSKLEEANNTSSKNNVVNNVNNNTNNNANTGTNTQNPFLQGNNNGVQNPQNPNIATANNNSTTTAANSNPTTTYVPTNIPTVLVFTSKSLSTADKTYSQTDAKIAWLESTYKNKIAVRNIIQELNGEDISRYNIKFFPVSVILNSKGEEIGRFEGDWTEQQITSKLNSLGIQ